MPAVAFAHPLWLLTLPLCLCPWLPPRRRGLPFPALAWLPADPLATHLDRLRRGLGCAFLAILILAQAGPYVREQKVARTGKGAHIVLTLDHSASMNEEFSAYLSGSARDSKSAAARRLLREFVTRRREDLFAMVAFSTAPTHILSLTQDHTAVVAAIDAVGRRGRGVTNIAPGLALALEEFRRHPASGNRVILLVSDGGAHIEPDTQERLRQTFLDMDARLYWIYLRNPRGISILHPPKRNLSETATPEYFIHQFFKTLKTPYRVFEADDPRSLADAIATVGKLENRQLHYFETLPRRDLSPFAYVLALILGLPILLWNALEIDRWLTTD